MDQTASSFLPPQDVSAPGWAPPQAGSAGDDHFAHRGDLAAGWDHVGQIQMDYLLGAGLEPRHRVLDIGCGALRTGGRLIAHLKPRHYFGIDSNLPLLEAGFKAELPPLLQRTHCPRGNLSHSPMFRHGRLADGKIDFGICFSVLQELTPNYVRILLEQSHRYLKPGGSLHVSYFELPEGQSYSWSYTNMARRVTYGHKAPYHFYRSSMLLAAEGTGWQAHHTGLWGHPEGESMMIYTKLA